MDNSLLAAAGEIVALPQAQAGAPQRKTVLMKTGDVELVHFLVPASANIPTHEAEGEIVLHCLQGRVEVLLSGSCKELAAGELLLLAGNAPFSIRGVEHSSLLATIITPKQGPNVELIGS
jgi:quercetin dioxygenase-like cupin family protein